MNREAKSEANKKIKIVIEQEKSDESESSVEDTLIQDSFVSANSTIINLNQSSSHEDNPKINLHNFQEYLNLNFSENKIKAEKFKMEKRIQDNLRLIKELENNSVELPRFLASCRSVYNLIKPETAEEILAVIDLFKQKLNCSIFLTFQNKNLKTFDEFEVALKNHYFKKTPAYAFYVQTFNIKQGPEESVNSYVSRLLDHKSIFLMQNDGKDMNLENIMLHALINGLTDKLMLFARIRVNTTFEELVTALQEQECFYLTSLSVSSMNVANILIDKETQFQDEVLFSTQNQNFSNTNNVQGYSNKNYPNPNNFKKGQFKNNYQNDWNQNQNSSDSNNFENFSQNAEPKGYFARNQRFNKNANHAQNFMSDDRQFMRHSCSNNNQGSRNYQNNNQ